MQRLLKTLVIIFGLAFATSDPTSKCPAPTADQAAKTSLALADFAINFYKNVSAEKLDKNTVMSPVSVALALALLENGASGSTRNLIKNLLIQQGSNVEVLSAYRDIQTQLKIDDEKSKLTIANALFPNQGLNLKQEYITTTKDCYDSEVQKVDFQQLEETRQKINKWVSDKTNAKIPELFKSGVLTPDTVLVLANAIYFKAAWQNAFQTQNTQKQIFYKFGRQQEPQNVSFMRNSGTYRYAATDNLQILELTYTNQDLAMYVFLPKAIAGLNQFERSLSGEKFKELISGLQSQQMKIEMPKFTMRLPVDLKGILSNMGLSIIFSDGAEFGRMSNAALKVSKAIHEAYINVNENGTEAAAATGFSMVPRSGPPPATKFVVDRPFMYTIVHKKTSAILFLGKVNFIEEEKN
jgi:serpin B